MRSPVKPLAAGTDVCTAAPIAAPTCPTDGKPFATLRARAALAGFTLCTMTETDGLCFYLLSRWGLSRTLPDLAAVVVFLRQVGRPSDAPHLAALPCRPVVGRQVGLMAGQAQAVGRWPAAASSTPQGTRPASLQAC